MFKWFKKHFWPSQKQVVGERMKPPALPVAEKISEPVCLLLAALDNHARWGMWFSTTGSHSCYRTIVNATDKITGVKLEATHKAGFDERYFMKESVGTAYEDAVLAKRMFEVYDLREKIKAYTQKEARREDLIEKYKEFREKS